MTDSAIDPEPQRDDLLATKLFRPAPRRGLVHRPRLTARLLAGLTTPLTVVAAPAGWGKSTLLAGWLDLQESPAPDVAWIALDEQDNEPARFLRYLIGAVQSIHPRLGRAALSRLQSPRPAHEGVITLLLNDLSSLAGDLVLVLDDYHAVEADAIHQAVTTLVEHLPPRVHLVMATRTEPPLPLARLRARGQLTELGAADLAFAPEESAAFLNESMGLALLPDDVAALADRTEGWIAGLHLAALALRDRPAEHRHNLIAGLSGTHRHVLDYLAGEVFDRQPGEIRRFLLATSILSEVTGSLADAVIGGTSPATRGFDGQAMLRRLDDAGLFLVRLDDTRTWYRYHHLFAEFLRERLRREHPELLPDVHRRAAGWLEEHGRSAPAAEHALAAGDHDEAARLVEQVLSRAIWQRGEVMTLRRWLTELPRAATRRRPRLSLDLAWTALWSGLPEAIEARVEDAEAAAGGAPEPRASALRGEAASIRAELARRRGDRSSAIAMARRALADLPLDESRVRAATSGLLGQALLESGDAIGAGEAFAAAAALGRPPETVTLSLIAQGRVMQTEVLQGRLWEAESLYRQILASAEKHGMAETPAMGVAQVYMAEIRREWNDLEQAEALAREGIARCAGWAGLAEMGIDGHITLARVLQARGDTTGAVAALDAAEALGFEAQVPTAGERVDLARARLALAAGNQAALVQWIRARPPLEVPDGYLGLLKGIVLARSYLSRAETADAMALLDRLLPKAEAGGLAGCAIEIRTLRALCLRAQGQSAQSLLALASALSMAEPPGYVRVFLDEGPRLPVLLAEARSRGVMTAYVDRLLSAAGTAGADRDQAPAEALSRREVELLRLLASGLTTTEIAGELYIAPGTARNHLKNIFGKLDVHTRLQAVERARILNML